MTWPRIVDIVSRGLRCREPDCRRPIALVATARGRTMPLELNPIPLNPDTDLRGLFCLVEHSAEGPPTAYGVLACRALGLDPDVAYLAHWAGCTKPARFRRVR